MKGNGIMKKFTGAKAAAQCGARYEYYCCSDSTCFEWYGYNDATCYIEYSSNGQVCSSGVSQCGC